MVPSLIAIDADHAKVVQPYTGSHRSWAGTRRWQSPRHPLRRHRPTPQGYSVLLLSGFPDGVLGAAYSGLNLPCGFLGGPFGLSLGVSGHLADSLFDFALYLMSDAHDAIFIHDGSLSCGCFTRSPQSPIRQKGQNCFRMASAHEPYGGTP